MAMPFLQRYPWNLYLINNVEDIAVFLVLKVFSLVLIYTDTSMGTHAAQVTHSYSAVYPHLNDFTGKLNLKSIYST